MPMHVEVITATSEDKSIIERLLQLYEHDNSEFFGADVDPDGIYRVADIDAIWHPSRHVFLIKVDDRLAGFAFVTRHLSYLGDGETYLMDEFFIMRKYRRRGVGEQVARTLFDRFPGRWEVSEWPTNIGAHAFWRRVIGRYTNGQFHEVDLDTPRIRGLVQSFETAGERV
ncbi:MAG: GNAT family N-acetyltransferase [Thermomicrobiales bacterium]